MNKTIITVVGKDTVGIIAKVCTYLAENGINILDISQTIVQGYFNMMMIVDANDLDVDLLGKGNQLRDWKQDQLLALIVDNPAGQNRQLTPFILIREIQQT